MTPDKRKKAARRYLSIFFEKYADSLGAEKIELEDEIVNEMQQEGVRFISELEETNQYIDWQNQIPTDTFNPRVDITERELKNAISKELRKIIKTEKVRLVDNGDVDWEHAS